MGFDIIAFCTGRGAHGSLQHDRLRQRQWRRCATPVTQVTSRHREPPDDERRAQRVTVELRSVNGRFLDLSLRLPDELRSLEPALRELITALPARQDRAAPGHARRRRERLAAAAARAAEPFGAAAKASVQGWLPEARGLSVHEVLQWCKGGAPAERLDEAALDAARAASPACAKPARAKARAWSAC